MDLDPVAAQGGDQRPGIGEQQQRRRHHHRRREQHEAQQVGELALAQDHHEPGGDREQREHRAVLVHVPPRHALRGDAPRHDAGEVRDVPAAAIASAAAPTRRPAVVGEGATPSTATRVNARRKKQATIAAMYATSATLNSVFEVEASCSLTGIPAPSLADWVARRAPEPDRGGRAGAPPAPGTPRRTGSGVAGRARHGQDATATVRRRRRRDPQPPPVAVERRYQTAQRQRCGQQQQPAERLVGDLEARPHGQVGELDLHRPAQQRQRLAGGDHHLVDQLVLAPLQLRQRHRSREPQIGRRVERQHQPRFVGLGAVHAHAAVVEDLGVRAGTSGRRRSAGSRARGCPAPPSRVPARSVPWVAAPRACRTAAPRRRAPQGGTDHQVRGEPERALVDRQALVVRGSLTRTSASPVGCPPSRNVTVDRKSAGVTPSGW